MSNVKSEKLQKAILVAGILTGAVSGSSLFYADITRSFGGDYEMQWKLNAGIRYAF